MGMNSPHPRRTPPLNSLRELVQFLSRYRQLPVVCVLQASVAAYTFLVEPARPSWALSGGGSQ
ncbi:hypothetical protein [Streptomyces lavenduligriseus]|uniref:Uncharacterized protein n=1 Tax=Streptomyces lavenduligriseus TaxID=67315 RepID=A0ABT0P600_9ACTN|nr:hypothetical protein [Streptomyces lavenduligriseus]MCL3999169.1 hypothetical protein [Streptomyces lavenduligriseus]